MIDPEMSTRAPRACAERSRDACAELLGGVADADDAIPQDASDGFRHQADRIGEVDEQRVRSAPFDDLGDVRDDGHGPRGELIPPAPAVSCPMAPASIATVSSIRMKPASADPDRAVDDVGAIDGVLDRVVVRYGTERPGLHPPHP